MAIDEGIIPRELEVFQSFMTLGNMDRMSEALGQSTVSVHRALHSLEEGLHCPLFKRDGRKLAPLFTAYVFAGHAKRILAECKADVRRTREAAGFSSAMLEIGGLYSMTIDALPHIFVGLKTHRSALDIEPALGSSRNLLARLGDGQLDAIVIALDGPLRNPGLLTVPVFDDEILFAAPLSLPYASSVEIDLQTVRSEEFIALSDDFATCHDFMATFDKTGFAPQTAPRVDDIFSPMNLASGGIGYVLLPCHAADFNPKM